MTTGCAPSEQTNKDVVPPYPGAVGKAGRVWTGTVFGPARRVHPYPRSSEATKSPVVEFIGWSAQDAGAMRPVGFVGRLGQGFG